MGEQRSLMMNDLGNDATESKHQDKPRVALPSAQFGHVDGLLRVLELVPCTGAIRAIRSNAAEPTSADFQAFQSKTGIE
jgi:hypothetical protein